MQPGCDENELYQNGWDFSGLDLRSMLNLHFHIPQEEQVPPNTGFTVVSSFFSVQPNFAYQMGLFAVENIVLKN